jgi:hypothetical protein
VAEPPKNGAEPRVPSLIRVSDHPSPVARPYAPSALPSTTARLLAFLAIVVGGVCGGVIGWSVTDLQCGPDERPGVEQEVEDDCGTVMGLGAVAGGVIGAGGVAVVAVLVLRAMAEWRRDMDLEEEPVPPPDEPSP